MQNTLRSCDPDQILLPAPSANEWIPAGDLAHFIGDVVDELNLSEILATYETGELCGYRPYHTQTMTSCGSPLMQQASEVARTGEAGQS